VALAAIQGLYKLLRERDERIAELESRMRTLEEQISSLQKWIEHCRQAGNHPGKDQFPNASKKWIVLTYSIKLLFSRYAMDSSLFDNWIRESAIYCFA
jgi:hypothetical protein